MKNRIIFLIFLIFIYIKNISYAQEMFNFETKSIEITENGNLINATNGKAVSGDKNIEVIADNFQYSNNSKTLKVNGNAQVLIKSDNLKIKFDEGVIDHDNPNRGRLTQNFTVAPFFEHVKKNEYGY